MSWHIFDLGVRVGLDIGLWIGVGGATLLAVGALARCARRKLHRRPAA